MTEPSLPPGRTPYVVRAAVMSLQPASLLFVVFTGLFYELASTVVNVPYLWILPACIVAFWLARYAYAMLERAADGQPEAPVVSAEMLGPFDGPGPLVHAIAGFAVYRLVISLDDWRAALLAVLSLALLPASVSVLGVTHRWLDSLNPLVVVRVIRALGHYYLLILSFTAIAAALGVALERSAITALLRYGIDEILVIAVYCVIGGSLFMRRMPLGLEPRHSPERAQEKAEALRGRDRQRRLDAIYGPLRARDYRAALTALKVFLDAASGADLPTAVRAVLDQAVQWNDPRGLSELFRGIAANLAERNELSLALTVLDEACRRLPDFALETEAATLLLARHARRVGRRGFGLLLINRFETAAPGRRLSPPAAALRSELGG